MEDLKQFKHVHLIGIGGSGMSAIAGILLERGFEVSGSDLSSNEMTRRLAGMGARIYPSHEAANVQGADMVVTSTAIGRENPERRAADEAGIPIWHRSRVLAAIMDQGRSVAICGTHGKTTTTSMMGLMLFQAGFDPTVLIGGELNDFGGNARSGRGEWVVAEADESDASFLAMHPDRIICTNVEADHLDYYEDLDAIARTFTKFFGQARPGGKIVACLDCPRLSLLVGEFGDAVIPYSLSKPAARMRAEAIEPIDGGRGTRFTPVWDGRPLEPVSLRVPGIHNVSNALGALACGLDLGADPEAMRRALGAYGGARRRFQVKGVRAGVTIVDDYAHHPSEIQATLAAARGQVGPGGKKRIVGAFQPHRYSRTQRLAEDFGRALQGVDLLVVTDVYSAGEKPIPGVGGRLVYDAAVANGHANAHFRATLDETRLFLAERLEAGDLFLTLGAGNIWQVGERLLEDLGRRPPVAENV